MTTVPAENRSDANGPGALVVVLCRGRTSTDVLLFGDEAALEDLEAEGATESLSRPLPHARARPDCTQWQLAESLLTELCLEAVTRLYASPFTLQDEDEAFGIFVAFVDGGSPATSLRAAGEWMDLRAAIARLPEPWSARLGAVRQHFIARSPDEALRVR